MFVNVVYLKSNAAALKKHSILGPSLGRRLNPSRTMGLISQEAVEGRKSRVAIMHRLRVPARVSTRYRDSEVR